MQRPAQSLCVIDGSTEYYFDAVIKAQHTSSLEIEDDPADAAGGEYTNSAKKNPDEVTVDIKMTDVITTIDALSECGSTRSVNAHVNLVNLQIARRLVQLRTKLKLYTNMLVESVVATEDESTMDGLMASVTFREVTPQAPAAAGGGSTKKTTKPKTADSGETNAKEASLAYMSKNPATNTTYWGGKPIPTVM